MAKIVEPGGACHKRKEVSTTRKARVTSAYDVPDTFLSVPPLLPSDATMPYATMLVVERFFSPPTTTIDSIRYSELIFARRITVLLVYLMA